MQIKKFNVERDYVRVRDFLTECYLENHNMECWLPARYEDLIFRVDTLYRDERGKLASQDFIYIWEDNGEIVAVIIPDGDSFNTCIKSGYEYLFTEMLDLGEIELQPLFDVDDNGEIDFVVVSHDSLTYQREELLRRGYFRQIDGDCDNYLNPQDMDVEIILPEGFKQVYGYDILDNKKAKACHYGFKPEDDDGILEGSFREGALAYQGRKKSLFFNDSFESLVVTNDGDICTYCFCYVDKITNTAFIEPVCTRRQYRNMGLCRAMLYGVIIKLKEMGIDAAYINSYAWRRKVYNSIGFETIDTISFWSKKLVKRK